MSTMNSSAIHPSQSLPWNASFLSVPKKPSHAALLGLVDFLDIDLAIPAASHLSFQPGHR